MGLFSKKTTTQIDADQRVLIEHAQQRIKQKKRLYYHFVVFLAGAILFIVLNLVLNIGKDIKPFGKDWFIWAILFWVFLLLIHFINVFVLGRFLNKSWEEEQFNSLIKKQKDKISQLQERVTQSHPLPKLQVAENNASTPTTEPTHKITIIAAAAENNALGKDNDLPWRLPDDFKRFKSLTSGHHIIMGRKTWDSLPNKLPNRTHLIISRQEDLVIDDATVVKDFATALDIAKEDTNIFIIGGGEIYNLAWEYASHIELTRVHDIVNAHVFLPEIDLTQWNLIARTFNPKDEKHEHAFSYETYMRRQ